MALRPWTSRTPRPRKRELPSGSIEGNTTELTIRTMGLMHTTQEFNDLVVREASNRIIRLSDVGRAELAPQDTRGLRR